MLRVVFGCKSSLSFPGTVTRRQLVVGFGVDPAPSAAAVPAPVLLDARPYVLCLGKVLTAKACHALARLFRAYKRRRPGELALVFAGPVVDALDATGSAADANDVVVLGPVDEDTKAALLAHCTLLVAPSAYESLSLVVLEAWAAGRPVLVNGRCDVTRDHCDRHGGGLWFVDYATFEAALDRLVTDPDLAEALGAAGHDAVTAHFSWPTVIDRYLAFLGACLS